MKTSKNDLVEELASVTRELENAVIERDNFETSNKKLEALVGQLERINREQATHIKDLEKANNCYMTEDARLNNVITTIRGVIECAKLN